jgi:hypothetical protein
MIAEAVARTPVTLAADSNWRTWQASVAGARCHILATFVQLAPATRIP